MNKFIRRIVSVLLAGTMALTSTITSSVISSAESSATASVCRVWDGSVDVSWYKKGKTEYDITTPEQLAGIAAICNCYGKEIKGIPADEFKGVTFNLKKDLMMNDTTGWENWLSAHPLNNWSPIGLYGGTLYQAFFRGTFNGNGHTISGIYAVGTGNHGSGLFGCISGACIKNLRIEKSMFYATGKNVGAIASAAESSNIECCEVDDVKIYLKNSNNGNAMGGIVGSTGRIDMTAEIAMLFLLGFGIVFNPIIWDDSITDIKGGGSLINSCKVTNCDMIRASQIFSNNPCSGAIAGVVDNSLIMGCLSANNSVVQADQNWKTYDVIYNMDISDAKKFKTGSIVGAQNNTKFKRNYAYNFSNETKERTDWGISGISVVNKSKITSKDVAEKLGKAYKYVKNSLPVLTAISSSPAIRAELTDKLNGYGCSIHWDKVSGAKSYTIYQKSGNTYKTYKTVTNTNIYFSNLKASTTYNLLVKANLNNGSQKDIGGAFKVKVPKNSFGSLDKYNGHKYKAFDVDGSFEHAKALCESIGGHLVTITSAKEQKFVQGLMKDHRDGSKRAYWIGAVHAGGKTFKWVTNEKFSYNNLLKNALNNRKSDEVNMVILNYYSYEIGKWRIVNNTAECGFGQYLHPECTGFICEWDS